MAVIPKWFMWYFFKSIELKLSVLTLKTSWLLHFKSSGVVFKKAKSNKIVLAGILMDLILCVCVKLLWVHWETEGLALYLISWLWMDIVILFPLLAHNILFAENEKCYFCWCKMVEIEKMVKSKLEQYYRICDLKVCLCSPKFCRDWMKNL